MARYTATITLHVTCPDDQAAAAAGEDLKKFVQNPLVKATLAGRGITIVGEPAVKIGRKP